MANVNYITGAQGIIRGFKTRNNRLASGTARGLKIAGLHLQRVSQTKVPIEYGILKASAYTRATGSGFSTVVNIGYTAAYAIFVHENIMMAGKGRPRPSGRGNYWDPNGQAKFLEGPARTERRVMRKIIWDNAKLFK